MASKSGAPANEERTENPSSELFPCYKNLDHLIKEGFKVFGDAMRTSNPLSTGRDFDFYKNFDSFTKITNDNGDRILHMMNSIMKCKEIESNMKHRILEEKTELVIEANDVLLERVAINIVEMNGTRKRKRERSPSCDPHNLEAHKSLLPSTQTKKMKFLERSNMKKEEPANFKGNNNRGEFSGESTGNVSRGRDNNRSAARNHEQDNAGPSVSNQNRNNWRQSGRSHQRSEIRDRGRSTKSIRSPNDSPGNRGRRDDHNDRAPRAMGFTLLEELLSKDFDHFNQSINQTRHTMGNFLIYCDLK